MKTVNCEGVEYLAHEAEGNAARWVMPLAQYYCKGVGMDVGYSKIEWKLPNAFGIDDNDCSGYNALNLPDISIINSNPAITHWDYLFSSHMLEHLQGNWMTCLDYWLTKIKVGGILFLYLPHASQNYWQPRNNRKHVHSFHGDEIGEYLRNLGHQVFISGVDANHSFTVICEKRGKNEPNLKTGDGKQTWSNLPYNKVDSNGDVLMPGCFDKSISQSFMGEFKGSSKGYRCKTFFQQNNIELQNKIKEYTEQLKPFNIDAEKESLHAHINKIRQWYNFSPLTIQEFNERILK